MSLKMKEVPPFSQKKYSVYRHTYIRKLRRSIMARRYEVRKVYDCLRCGELVYGYDREIDVPDCENCERLREYYSTWKQEGEEEWIAEYVRREKCTNRLTSVKHVHYLLFTIGKDWRKKNDLPSMWRSPIPFNVDTCQIEWILRMCGGRMKCDHCGSRNRVRTYELAHTFSICHTCATRVVQLQRDLKEWVGWIHQ